MSFLKTQTGFQWFAFCISKIFIVISVCALLYQITLVNQIYFGFSVVTGVKVYIPPVNRPMAITVCVRATEVLDFERLNADTGRNFAFTQDEDTNLMMADSMTAAEILKYTPSEKDALEKIIYRKNYSYKLQEVNSSNIIETFNIEKFSYLDYVCYMISKIDEGDQKLSFSSLAVTPVFSGLIYEMRFDKELFHRVDFIKVVIGEPGITPYRPLMVTPQLRRFYNSTQEPIPDVGHYNLFTLYQSLLVVHMLPPPYQTKCFNYTADNAVSRTHCAEECIKDRIVDQTNQIPFTYIVTENSTDIFSKELISYRSVTSNQSLTDFLYKTENYCFDQKCGLKGCQESTSSTKGRGRMGVNDQFTVRQIIPLDPWITIFTTPYMSFVEYFTYVTSIVATYTGVTFLTLNPIQLFEVFRQKLYTRRRRSNSRVRDSKHDAQEKDNEQDNKKIKRQGKKLLKDVVVETGDLVHLNDSFKDYELNVLNIRLHRLEQLYEMIINKLFIGYNIQNISSVRKDLNVEEGHTCSRNETSSSGASFHVLAQVQR